MGQFGSVGQFADALWPERDPESASREERHEMLGLYVVLVRAIERGDTIVEREARPRLLRKLIAHDVLAGHKRRVSTLLALDPREVVTMLAPRVVPDLDDDSLPF